MSRFTKGYERGGEAGFTMFESLVALAVIAIVLAAIGSLIAANARGTRMISERLSLVQSVRMLLTSLPDGNQLAADDKRGQIGDDRWRIDVLRFTAQFIHSDQPAPWIPLAVVVRVESPSGEILRVDTVRLRPAQGNAK